MFIFLIYLYFISYVFLYGAPSHLAPSSYVLWVRKHISILHSLPCRLCPSAHGFLVLFWDVRVSVITKNVTEIAKKHKDDDTYTYFMPRIVPSCTETQTPRWPLAPTSVSLLYRDKDYEESLSLCNQRIPLAYL